MLTFRFSFSTSYIQAVAGSKGVEYLMGQDKLVQNLARKLRVVPDSIFSSI